MGERTLAFRVDEKLHRDLKIRLAKKGVTLKDYVIGLIESDMYNQDHPIDINKLKECAQQIYDNSKSIVEMTNKK